MPPSDPPPRIPQLRPEEFSEEAKAMFARWTGGIFGDADTNPVLKTLAHHPQLTDLFSQLNIHLLATSTVPVRYRQMAIMRTAWLCKATYMWSSHLNTSQLLGLPTDMFVPIRNGPTDTFFTDFERGVLRATEELVSDRLISDGNWALLRAEWDEAQMLDFMFTVGVYVAIAGVMRSAGIQREQDLIALGEIYGVPE